MESGSRLTGSRRHSEQTDSMAVAAIRIHVAYVLWVLEELVAGLVIQKLAQ